MVNKLNTKNISLESLNEEQRNLLALTFLIERKPLPNELMQHVLDVFKQIVGEGEYKISKPAGRPKGKQNELAIALCVVQHIKAGLKTSHAIEISADKMYCSPEKAKKDYYAQREFAEALIHEMRNDTDFLEKLLN